jgi:hypothetical protein
MRTRPLLAAAVAAAAVVLTPLATGTAQAKSLETIDKTTFDSSATVTASTIHIDNATAGELGGYLDLTITAQDGALPTAAGACETADVDAVVTVAPGETLTVHTTGDICAHPFSASTLTLTAYYGDGDLAYAGTAHKKAKVVGDGLISASNGTFFGWGASFSGQVRW